MNRTSGVGLSTVLFCIFLTLKLTGNIAWSWWWVCSPLWISFGVGAIALLIYFLIYYVVAKS